MNYKIFWIKLPTILLLILFLLPLSEIKAQSPEPNIERLTIALWPEYDKPDVLVLHRIQLDPETTFPVQMTFRLPGHIELMHAVALNTDEGLINVEPDKIETRYEDDNLILSFPASAPELHFEYYDPVILTQQGNKRQLNFSFSTPYNIKAASIEVQQPFEAENFTLTPAAQTTITGNDLLKYSTILMEDGMTAGETVELSATYQRDTNQLSVNELGQASPSGNTASAPPVSNTDALTTSSYLAYALLAAGVILLAGTLGYWWWQRRQYAKPQTSRRQPRRQKIRKSKQKLKHTATSPTPRAITHSNTAYCYNCGNPLRPDANFCHACGAECRKN